MLCNALKWHKEVMLCLYMWLSIEHFLCEAEETLFWSFVEIVSTCCITANDLVTQVCGHFKTDQPVIYLCVMHFRFNKHALIE